MTCGMCNCTIGPHDLYACLWGPQDEAVRVVIICERCSRKPGLHEINPLEDADKGSN
jgi:hypothetical protein